MEPILLPSLVLSDVQPTPIPELKPILENLKYAYLVDDEKLLVIISTSLEAVQEKKLFQMLTKHKKAMPRPWQSFLVSVHPSVSIEYYWRMDLDQ